jgi:hypothetical protein
VTFHNVLKFGALPLDQALRALLTLFRDGMGSAVEIEFALEASDWGRMTPRGTPAPKHTLYVLQVRPQAQQALESDIQTQGHPEGEIVCTTDRSLGHGLIDTIEDIVVVTRSDLEATDTPAVAQQVGEFNAALQAEKRPYLLVGPGRWGSSDPRLGIPVKWGQIAGAKVIIETDFATREVEPSQGAHFFHNVTCFRIGYLSLSNMDHRATVARRRIDMDWLDAQPTFAATSMVRHIRLDVPLRVYLDGRSGSAAILRPAVGVDPAAAVGVVASPPNAVE